MARGRQKKDILNKHGYNRGDTSGLGTKAKPPTPTLNGKLGQVIPSFIWNTTIDKHRSSYLSSVCCSGSIIQPNRLY